MNIQQIVDALKKRIQKLEHEINSLSPTTDSEKIKKLRNSAGVLSRMLAKAEGAARSHQSGPSIGFSDQEKADIKETCNKLISDTALLETAKQSKDVISEELIKPIIEGYIFERKIDQEKIKTLIDDYLRPAYEADRKKNEGEEPQGLTVGGSISLGEVVGCGFTGAIGVDLPSFKAVYLLVTIEGTFGLETGADAGLSVGYWFFPPENLPGLFAGVSVGYFSPAGGLTGQAVISYDMVDSKALFGAEVVIGIGERAEFDLVLGITEILESSPLPNSSRLLEPGGLCRSVHATMPSQAHQP